MKRELTRIVSWGHELLSEVVHDGDLAVDLTAGNGQDTLTLFRMVGKKGRVISFDIQKRALERTAVLLEQAGACVRKKLNACPRAILSLGWSSFPTAMNASPVMLIRLPWGLLLI